MRDTLTFTAAAIGLVALGTGALALVVSAPARGSIVAAAVLALGLQMLLHFGLVRLRRDPKRFVAGILLGATARMAVVGTVLVVAWQGRLSHPVAFLLTLAGFLVALLVLESALDNFNLFRSARGTAAAADPALRARRAET